MEMIVAVGVFAVVATIAVGSLLVLTSIEQRVNSNQVNQDNIRFAVEAMAREIRTGLAFNTDSCSPSPCLSFTNLLNNYVVYSLDTATFALKRSEGGSTAYPGTAPEVKIESLNFYVIGVEPNDNYQPAETLALRATSPKDSPKAVSLAVQTTISQNQLDQRELSP